MNRDSSRSYDILAACAHTFPSAWVRQSLASVFTPPTPVVCSPPLAAGVFHWKLMLTAAHWPSRVKAVYIPPLITATLFLVTISAACGQLTGLQAGTGGQTCAIVNGGAFCWGSNVYGALGDGSTVQSSVAVPVLGLSAGVTAISSSGAYTTFGWSTRACAIQYGVVWCWGELYYSSSTPSDVPIKLSGVPGGVSVAAVSVGYASTCLLTSSAAVWCWGNDDSGQLGDGTTSTGFQSTLTPVLNLAPNITAISAGFYHVCALMISGGMACWGNNVHGQIGK